MTGQAPLLKIEPIYHLPPCPSFRSDTSVQHFGCWALANVGWGQADVQKFAREEGAMEVIQVNRSGDQAGRGRGGSGHTHCVLHADHILRLQTTGEQYRLIDRLITRTRKVEVGWGKGGPGRRGAEGRDGSSPPPLEPGVLNEPCRA